MKKMLVVMLLLPSMAFAAQTLKQGAFNCEAQNSYDRHSLSVQQHPTKAHKIVLNWQGKDRILHQVATRTGALRFEGAVSGLVYVQAPHHSVLLDNKTMKVLLSDCLR